MPIVRKYTFLFRGSCFPDNERSPKISVHHIPTLISLDIIQCTMYTVQCTVSYTGIEVKSLTITFR